MTEHTRVRLIIALAIAAPTLCVGLAAFLIWYLFFPHPRNDFDRTDPVAVNRVWLEALAAEDVDTAVSLYDRRVHIWGLAVLASQEAEKARHGFGGSGRLLSAHPAYMISFPDRPQRVVILSELTYEQRTSCYALRIIRGEGGIYRATSFTVISRWSRCQVDDYAPGEPIQVEPIPAGEPIQMWAPPA